MGNHFLWQSQPDIKTVQGLVTRLLNKNVPEIVVLNTGLLSEAVRKITPLNLLTVVHVDENLKPCNLGFRGDLDFLVDYVDVLVIISDDPQPAMKRLAEQSPLSCIIGSKGELWFKKKSAS